MGEERAVAFDADFRYQESCSLEVGAVGDRLVVEGRRIEGGDYIRNLGLGQCWDGVGQELKGAVFIFDPWRCEKKSLN